MSRNAAITRLLASILAPKVFVCERKARERTPGHTHRTLFPIAAAGPFTIHIAYAHFVRAFSGPLAHSTCADARAIFGNMNARTHIAIDSFIFSRPHSLSLSLSISLSTIAAGTECVVCDISQ